MKSSEWRYVFILEKGITTFLRSRIPVKPNLQVSILSFWIGKCEWTSDLPPDTRTHIATTGSEDASCGAGSYGNN